MGWALLRPAGIGLAQAQGWHAEARVGCELESTHEEFGSGSLSDVRLDPATEVGTSPDPEGSILARRFIDRTTRWSAISELTAEREHGCALRSHLLLHLGRLRSRGDVEAGVDAPTRLGRLGATARYLFQGGPEGGGAGQSLTLRSTWSSPRRWLGCEVRCVAAGERSWAGHDSLSVPFDYARWFPSAEVRRRVGGGSEFAIRGGIGRKEARSSVTGDYRERWIEGEWSRVPWRGPQWSLHLRSESRAYPGVGAGLPSYDEVTIEGETELEPWRHWRVRLAPSCGRSAYASDDSLVFRDHWSAELLLRVERTWSAESDTAQPSAGVSGFVGWRQVLLRNERAREGDFQAVSFVFGGGREPTSRWWLDASGEIGRRDYHRSGGGGTLVYEGYNLTVAGTDFTFVSGSMIAQISTGRRLRWELFGLFDQELHHGTADDFSLWSLTGALTWSL